MSLARMSICLIYVYMSRDRRARWCTDDRINSRHGDRARLGREWERKRERERERKIKDV